MRLKSHIAAVAAVMAASVLLGAAAPAAAWHQYSGAYENSQANPRGYTGSHAKRNVIGLNNTTCNQPVYDTQWVMLDSGADSFLEFGTAYDCPSICPLSGACRFDYVYWEDHGQGSWELKIYYPPLESRTYRIERRNNNHERWKFVLLGENVKHVTYTDVKSGEWVGVALESYNSSITVPTHQHFNLQRKRWDNEFMDWAGKDDEDVDPSMCGEWVSDIKWKVGENTTC
jgi:hypothetical protein